MNIKIGVTGAQGRVGTFLTSNYEYFVPLDCDVRNADDVENCIGNAGVQAVLHLAAKSDVNFCEMKENAKYVSDVNLRGTFNVCHAAENVGNIPVVLVSSDHVFSGTRGKYKEKDVPHPVNYYGLSKLSAESLQKVFSNLKVIRTSYIFDQRRLAPHVYKAREGTPQLYPTFMFRSFIYLSHFCNQVIEYFMDLDRMPEILHLGGNISLSWCTFMREVFDACDLDYDKLALPRTQDNLKSGQARRPAWAGLDTRLSAKLGINQFSYSDGIKQMLIDDGDIL